MLANSELPSNLELVDKVEVLASDEPLDGTYDSLTPLSSIFFEASSFHASSYIITFISRHDTAISDTTGVGTLEPNQSMKELTAKGKDGVLSVKKNQIDCELLGSCSALLTMLSAVNSFDSSWFALKKNRLFSGVKEELLVTSEGRNPRVSEEEIERFRRLQRMEESGKKRSFLFDAFTRPKVKGTGPSPQGQIPDTEGEAPLKAGSITRA
ncbi:unnamed protein product [Dovyalis caffra]|uniref:Uncharacterized protein n=1 Tax=Dovyalis caffra TaxID=77055 RepID=A0AAV1QUR4_9ROSI|nr:unnamed protein product [Dovyalis caffra]